MIKKVEFGKNSDLKCEKVIVYYNTGTVKKYQNRDYGEYTDEVPDTVWRFMYEANKVTKHSNLSGDWITYEKEEER